MNCVDCLHITLATHMKHQLQVECPGRDADNIIRAACVYVFWQN